MYTRTPVASASLLLGANEEVAPDELVVVELGDNVDVNPEDG